MREQIKSRWLKLYIIQTSLGLFNAGYTAYLQLVYLAVPLHTVRTSLFLHLLGFGFGSYLTLRCGYLKQGTKWLRWVLTASAITILSAVANANRAYGETLSTATSKMTLAAWLLFILVFHSVQIGFWIYTLKLHDNNGNYYQPAPSSQSCCKVLKSNWLKYYLMSFITWVCVSLIELYERTSPDPKLSIIDLICAHTACVCLCLLILFLTLRYSYHRQGTFWLKINLLVQAIFWISAITLYCLDPQTWSSLHKYYRGELLYILGTFSTLFYVQLTGWIYTFRLQSAYEKALFVPYEEASS